jgi:hypothetical protein
MAIIPQASSELAFVSGREYLGHTKMGADKRSEIVHVHRLLAASKTNLRIE